MSFSELEGVVFLLAAIVAALEIPHGFRMILRWLLRRLKPLTRRPFLHQTIWVIAVSTTLIIVPIHAIAFALEAKNYLFA